MYLSTSTQHLLRMLVLVPMLFFLHLMQAAVRKTEMHVFIGSTQVPPMGPGHF